MSSLTDCQDMDSYFPLMEAFQVDGWIAGVILNWCFNCGKLSWFLANLFTQIAAGESLNPHKCTIPMDRHDYRQGRQDNNYNIHTSTELALHKSN